MVVRQVDVAGGGTGQVRLNSCRKIPLSAFGTGFVTFGDMS
ncbi:hypothetical protein [Micromonospora sp. WMMD980]|nr:hypothetical protein [Micromonospora sp. WMMD980]MDG4800031.1 hypothetical protein [Micromonospora sp. WMMD980]